MLAAKRAGIRTVILPERNRKDVLEIPKDIRSDMTFHYIRQVEEVLPLALADGWKAGGPIDWKGGAKGAPSRRAVSTAKNAKSAKRE